MLNYENYQCGIYKKRGLAASVSAGDTSGNSFCRAVQCGQIIFDQHACRAQELAKTSNTPGRTQLINFFAINEKVSFVDLPGYGFAKVAQSVKKDWGDMIEAYLRERLSLALVVFILDIRRDPSVDDLALRDWLEHYRIPYVYILTKVDKLSNNQAIAQKRAIEKALRVSAANKLILFSAITQKGKSDIWQFIEEHLSALPH